MPSGPGEICFGETNQVVRDVQVILAKEKVHIRWQQSPLHNQMHEWSNDHPEAEIVFEACRYAAVDVPI
jgi:hypothetical protein